MKRPDLESIIEPLKSFQRRTVDHAFERLFLAPDSTSRFLVADEVGLGKTLVARGIIGRAIDHMWDDVDRIDIIYICSNQSIARSNLPKLQVTGEEHHSFALATRLTMLATELAAGEGEASLANSKVNLVSFTPGTSFQMGHSSGQARERRVLFHLLEPLIERRTGLMNMLQGRIGRTRWWRDKLRYEPLPLEPEIELNFHQAFRRDKQLCRDVEELIDTWFLKQRKSYPKEARYHQNEVLGRLRRLLAEVCVHALEPDLVILDEFQRFKSLLESRDEYRDPTAELAQQLFHAQTPEGHPVRTLLLSATPYKLYTADAEIEQEDHYEDFLATARFLLGDDEQQVAQLKSQLSHFGRSLRRAAQGHPEHIPEAKASVETTLRSIMARTERVSASEDRDAMVEEPRIEINLKPEDVRQYLATDELFRIVGAQDPIEFWKSASYLPHFMYGYKVNEHMDDTLAMSPERISAVLRKHDGVFLRKRYINDWQQMEPAHAKLRELIADLLDTGLWKLLWMPPTVPYWPLDGPYRGQEQSTKSLLFSAWNVVPNVISAILSYEAERRMVGETDLPYEHFTVTQPLQLTQEQSGSRTRHRLLLLLMPCLALADEAHPLAAPAGCDRRAWVRERIEGLLAGSALPDPHEGTVDRRWEYIVPLLLDTGLRGFLQEWLNDPELDTPSPEYFPGYIEDLLKINPVELGRRPDNLAELVTDVALGSPAVIAARTVCNKGIDALTRRRCAARMAMAFWRLFNRPAVTRMLHQMAESQWQLQREQSVYWWLVMHYCRDGNLQAVMDEAWHLAWEQRAWSESESMDSIAWSCTTGLAENIEPRASRVHARLYETDGKNQVSEDELRVRTVFSLRFGHLDTEEGALTQDAVRAAFNSPFRPFVLTSTSIGQEGLDFHPWCHRLVHWNLPGNPVDLEQREGRVHRYKGHSVRRNVAARFAEPALEAWRPGIDLWARMFELANFEARENGESDLVPYWIAPGPCRVQRRVPTLPYTREVEAFRRLKHQLAAYRVVFGQPRQQELLTLLDRADIDDSELKAWTIDLSP